MGKSQGLIGNFNGKVGNMVGFKVSQSNNGTNQGVRIYQPIRKNPKTAAQAEQRAKYAPIFATYRALKSIIDRGQESKPYGNASRIAWLKQAFKASAMPWFEKGAYISSPVLCPITKGSLTHILTPDPNDTIIELPVAGIMGTEKTVGAVATAILDSSYSVNAGDQLTAVTIEEQGGVLVPHVTSIVLDPQSTSALPNDIAVEEEVVKFTDVKNAAICGCLIVSREGANGEHLRSTETLVQMNGYDPDIYLSDAKTAAIESYMASGAINENWSEEPI